MEQQITPSREMTSSDFLELEKRDEAQILAEIQGAVIEEMVYSFKSGGRTITGLSWVGVKEIARQYGHIDVELVDQQETPDAWIVTVKARDTENDTGILGVSIQPKMMQRRDGSPQPDPFALQKATSKAQRNAIRALIPEAFIKKVIEGWYQKKIGQNTPRRVEAKPRRVEARQRPRDTKNMIARDLEAEGLDVMQLDITESLNKDKLIVKPKPTVAGEDWALFNQVFTKYGKWLPDKQAWEVNLR